MEQTPIICPDCGELVLVWVTEYAQVVPVHPDRVTPFEDCVASTVAISRQS